jgi:biopolymer transport protein ExbD
MTSNSGGVVPIRYYCSSCRQLLSIASRKSGHSVDCPRCGAATIVPDSDVQEPSPSADVEPAVEPPESADAQSEAEAETEAAATAPREPPAFHLRNRETELDEMDLTPMVDMTFLLLIFFMITASFSLKSIEVPPPSPEQKGAAQTNLTLDDLQSNSIIVRIDDRNAITVDDEPVPDPSRLARVLRAALSVDRNELVLSADDAAYHETIVAVIDAANEAGLQRIRLASRGTE